MGEGIDIRRVPGLRLDLDALWQRVDEVLRREPYWFPVRHHSPTVARHLGQVIRERRPRLVLIEGPSEANHLVPHLLDAKTRPPVAIYSSYRDDDDVLGLAGVASPAPDIPARFASWYPLVPYSPELVALRAAKEVGAQCVLIDLPHHARVRPRRAADRPGAAGEALGEAGEAAGEVEADERSRGSEGLIAQSELYQRLASAAGFRSFDEAWDSLFELGGTRRSAEELRRDMAYFCAAARATTDPARIAADDTLPRERFMAREIRRQLETRGVPAAEAMVVTGGFHMLLDLDDPIEPPEPPPGPLYTTVVPYSYFRVAQQSGYAAGNRAPAFYQLQWDAAPSPEGHQELVIEHVTRVLRRARRKGEALSPADAIAVTQHAMMLGRLRGRREPVLDDIEDALLTCCCKGDPQEVGETLLQAMRECAIGSAVGRVTTALGRLPIVEDFHAQLHALGLDERLRRDRDELLGLDLRDPLDGRRAALLHRLAYLGAPLGSTQGLDERGGTVFRQPWVLRWDPKVESTLAERAPYGDTVEAAAIARLEEDLARERLSAGATVQRVLGAMPMELPGFAARLGSICGPAIDADARFASLAEALAGLLLLDEHAVHRELRRDVIADLAQRCFDRACFAVPNIASVPVEEEPRVVAGLVAVASALLGRHELELDRDLFADSVRIAAAQTTVPFMRGVFLGLLAEIRVLPAADLAAEISALARGSVEAMVTAGDFVRGAMAASRTSLLLGADALVGAIDDLLRAADWDTFLVMLPRLRQAFGGLRGAELGTLCDRVALRHGLRDAEELDLDLGVGAAALLAEVDHRVAEIMEGWEL
ncbi:MAG: hypothetical protein H6712_33640 [Myxococcales bacterium]|nr:hypothetical protein [Myxococcales bacterium]